MESIRISLYADQGIFRNPFFSVPKVRGESFKIRAVRNRDDHRAGRSLNMATSCGRMPTESGFPVVPASFPVHRSLMRYLTVAKAASLPESESETARSFHGKFTD